MQALNPLNYRIHLEPDLNRFKFDGQCEILLDAPQTVSEVTLNILDIAIWSCRLLKRDGDGFVACPFKVDPGKEEVRVTLPEATSGKIRLRIDYQGEINDKMAGFYRSKYIYQGETRFIAVTQFEESDARRAFPCFDHPLEKATFDIELIIDENLTAISNGTIIEEGNFNDLISKNNKFMNPTWRFISI